MKITVEFLEENGYESVTDYCRYLMEYWEPYCNYTPKDKIEVYRGDMLCLTVRSIEEGSKLRPKDSGGFKKYYPKKAATSPVDAFK